MSSPSARAAYEYSSDHLRRVRKAVADFQLVRKAKQHEVSNRAFEARIRHENEVWFEQLKKLSDAWFEMMDLHAGVVAAQQGWKQPAKKAWWAFLRRTRGDGGDELPPEDYLPPDAAEMSAAMTSDANAALWLAQGVQMYLQAAGATGEEAGGYALERLGLNKTFAWAHPQNMAQDLFATRGSKVIQNLYGSHMNALTRIIQQATDPRHPMSISQVVAKLKEEWPRLQAYQLERIARTETAAAWTTVSANAYSANGIREFESIIAHGPSIGGDATVATEDPCDECVDAAAMVHSIYDDCPPWHPNCRCEMIPVTEGDEFEDGVWLPPDEPWAGGDFETEEFLAAPDPELDIIGSGITLQPQIPERLSRWVSPRALKPGDRIRVSPGGPVKIVTQEPKLREGRVHFAARDEGQPNTLAHDYARPEKNPVQVLEERGAPHPAEAPPVVPDTPPVPALTQVEVESADTDALWSVLSRYGKIDNLAQADIASAEEDKVARELWRRMDEGLPNGTLRYRDLSGERHLHTIFSDGHNTIEEMANEARGLGHESITISDHAHLLTVEDVERQFSEIDRLNAKYAGDFKILKGIEVNILEDGTLDAEDTLLAKFDVVNAGMHVNRDVNATARYLKTLDNKHVTNIAHPHTSGMNVDWKALAAKAKQKGVTLEVNGREMLRRDTADAAAAMIRAAKEKGAKLTFASDAHRAGNFIDTTYAVRVAAKEGVTRGDLASAQTRRLIDDVSVPGEKPISQETLSLIKEKHLDQEIPPLKDPIAARVLRNHEDTKAMWTKGDRYKAERRPVHENAEEHFLKVGRTEEKPVALVMAGGPAAGKSVALRANPALEPLRAVKINPDEIMPFLPEAEAMKGSEYAAYGLHEEAADIAADLFEKAIEKRANILLDGVGNSGPGKFLSKLKRLKDAGYEVRVVMADAPVNGAIERNIARATKVGGPDEGRFLPIRVQKQLYRDAVKRTDEWMTSKYVDQWELNWTEGSWGDTAATTVARGGKGEMQILDPQLWQKTQSKRFLKDYEEQPQVGGGEAGGPLDGAAVDPTAIDLSGMNEVQIQQQIQSSANRISGIKTQLKRERGLPNPDENKLRSLDARLQAEQDFREKAKFMLQKPPVQPPPVSGHPTLADVKASGATEFSGKVEVWRTGPTGYQKRGVFFGDSAESIEPYRGLHADAPAQMYVADVKRAKVYRDARAAWQDLFPGGKSYAETFDSYAHQPGVYEAGAMRKIDERIAARLRAQGYDGLIYTEPAPPAKAELAILKPSSLPKPVETVPPPPVTLKPSALEEHAKTWLSDLKPRESDALKSYTEMDYEDVNALMRTGELTSGADVARTRGKIESIAGAIEKSKLPEDTTVYRGVQNIEKTLGDLTPGREITDKGFTSTTIDRASLSGYTQADSGVIEITVPKDYQAAYLNSPLVTNEPGEHEVLLQRESTMRIVSASHTPDGWEVKAEIVPKAEVSPPPIVPERPLPPDGPGYKTGRSPEGRLRNFRAMGDTKLKDTIQSVENEWNDPEALRALYSEFDARGLGVPITPPPPQPLPIHVKPLDDSRAVFENALADVKGERVRIFHNGIQTFEGAPEWSGTSWEIDGRTLGNGQGVTRIDVFRDGKWTKVAEKPEIAKPLPPPPPVTPPPVTPPAVDVAELKAQLQSSRNRLSGLNTRLKREYAKPGGVDATKLADIQERIRAEEQLQTQLKAQIAGAPKPQIKPSVELTPPPVSPEVIGAPAEEEITGTGFAAEVKKLGSTARSALQDLGGDNTRKVEKLRAVGKRVLDEVQATSKVDNAKLEELRSQRVRAKAKKNGAMDKLGRAEKELEDAMKPKLDSLARTMGYPDFQATSWQRKGELRREVRESPELAALVDDVSQAQKDFYEASGPYYKLDDETRALEKEIKLQEREELLATLADVRDMGNGELTYSEPHRLRDGKTPSNVPATRKAMDKAARFFPTEWVQDMRPANVSSARRGHHTSGDTLREMEILVSEHKNPLLKSDGQYFSTAMHEMAHEVEYRRIWVKRAEKAFYQYRTQGESLQSLRKLEGGGYKADEMTRPDEFAAAYMGKDYQGDAYELLTMGMEALFNGRWKLDPEYREWLIGVLASL